MIDTHRMGERVSTETRLLAAQVKLGDEKALRRIKAALRSNDGDVSKAAEELGVHRVTLYQWGREVPAVKVLLEEHGRGRGAIAAEAAPRRRRKA
jgi:hypothetical protein